VRIQIYIISQQRDSLILRIINFMLLMKNIYLFVLFAHSVHLLSQIEID